MVESELTGTANWARFDRYVEQEGYIRPAPGAQMEMFDPWSNYAGARSDSRIQEPPYGSLLTLAQAIELKPKPGPGPLLTLSADSETLVSEWCAQNGLLGILPHSVPMVTLAPRYGPMPDVEGRWVPWQRQFFRVNQEWVKTNRLGVRAGTVPRGAASQWKDKLVPPQELPEEWPKPEVLLQDLTTGGWKREPLAKTWARFFPDVPPSERETYAYPLPGTAEFWRLYAEPVYQFVEVATLLLSAIQGLGRLAEKDHTPEIKSEADRAIWALNTLISPTGPAADLSSGNQIEQRWYSPSLLGAFAMMALRDLSEQRWPRICDNCDKLFVTKAYQGRYCTDRCRYAAQKRRYRQRQKRQAKPNQ